jgi:integrase
MSKSRTPRTPSYRHHKPSGNAFIEIDGRRHYLGKYDSPESRQNYARMLGEWASNGYRLPVPTDQITLLEVADRYLEHADSYYLDSNGLPTSSLQRINRAIETALELYGNLPATQFGPVALRAVRQIWVDRDNSISTINGYVGALRLMFKWACAHEMVPVETHTALTTVAGLRKGRGVGKDPKDRVPASKDDVEAVVTHLPRQLQAVVRLLLHTGARPSEILNLKRGDIDCTDVVWVANIRAHKTSYRDKQRRLFFGPRAQAVLRPFLLRGDDEYLFSPVEAEKERHAKANSHRRPNQKANIPKTARTLGECFHHTSLNRAITRVCKEHDIPKWTPYQLRHLAATTIEATADLETASAILGHSGLDITQIYVHRDNKTAAAWAATHG